MLQLMVIYFGPFYILGVQISQSWKNMAVAIGFVKGNDAVKDQVQKTLEEMAADGTLAKISTKWFGEDITTIGK